MAENGGNGDRCLDQYEANIWDPALACNGLQRLTLDRTEQAAIFERSISMKRRHMLIVLAVIALCATPSVAMSKSGLITLESGSPYYQSPAHPNG